MWRDLAGWRPSGLMRFSAGWHGAMGLAAALAPGWWELWAGGLAANHALLSGLGMWPRSQGLGPNLRRLPASAAARQMVALTFDDGPDPTVTPAVLDLLEAAGATASFFCIGRRAAAHPALVAEIVRRGHSVENHSHAHGNLFACLGPWRLVREIRAAQAVLTELSGRSPHFFRAPMGLRNPFMDAAMHITGLRFTSWTRRGYDAVRIDPAGVLRRLQHNLAAGDILLLHDGNCARAASGRPVVLDVLPALLDTLARQGLRAVSLPAALAVTVNTERVSLPHAA